MMKSNKLIKMVLPIVLSVLLTFSALPNLVPPVLAAQSGDFTYSLIDNGQNVCITGYTGQGDKISIPSIIELKNVTAIGIKAFNNNSTIITVTIPSSVTIIAESAFAGCYNLATIKIPDSVTSIGDSAFLMCSSLITITIPNNVSSIGTNAFLGCSKLTAIDVGTKNDYYSSLDGALFNSNKTIFIKYPEGNTATSYTIPSSVTFIRESAFSYSRKLQAITIPDSVTLIYGDAFCYCDSLTSVAIPDGITNISMGTFSYCSSLTTVSIPKSVVGIGQNAFNQCINLKKIRIPLSVSLIGDNAFYNCYSMTAIDVDVDNTSFSSVDGVLFNKDKSVLMHYPQGKTTTSYIVPDGVNAVFMFAFNSCYNLTSVTFPESTVSINMSAFQYCENLSTVTIANGLVAIGNAAFRTCEKLDKIIIPVSVTSIAVDAFAGCFDLVIYGDKFSYAQSYAQINNIPFIINEDILPTASPTVSPIASPTDTPIITPTPTPIITPTDTPIITPTDTPIITPTPTPIITPTATPIITPTPTISFPDIEGVEWAREAIINLAYNNVINGYEDGTFRPDNFITRAEFTKMFVVTFDIYFPTATTTFDDVSAEQWYASYVGSAQNEGLAQGIGDNMFSPESTITREEMFTFCARAIVKYKSLEMLSTVNDSAKIQELIGHFVDANTVSDWAREFVATCIKYGLIAGSPVEGGGKAINPTNAITRAEVAVALYRTTNLLPPPE